ncbi:hypothetical protein ABZ690_28155 [Streptomyces sp. NPDC006967]
MALGFKKPIPADDPRLDGHDTTYSSCQGGWVKTKEKPVPGKPKKDRRG